MSTGFNLFMIAVLIILTAFFVATEFAIIRLRSSRVDQLVVEGRKNARAVQHVTRNLDGYLSACQLGITITALGLGWLGEPTVEKILYPVFENLNLNSDVSHILSFLIAFIIVTFLHVVIGELAPKTWAIQKPEFITFAVAKPIMLFHKIMYPFIWLLNGSANALTRMFGLKPVSEHEEAHTEEEIQIILNDSLQSGKINNAEYGYMNRIFAFDEMVAKDIMVPRTDMVCLYTNLSLKENMDIIRKEQYTRYPVASGNKDQIVGMINTKQMFLEYDANPDIDVKKLIHPVMAVSEVLPLKTLLQRMQQERVHMAILMDEFGGTSGLITIEDILEEIVGEIRDEFDADERKEVEKLGDNRYLLDGKITLDEISGLTGVHIDKDDVDTIGGWIYTETLNPAPDAAFQYGKLTFIVREVSKHRVRKVEMVIGENESIRENVSS